MSGFDPTPHQVRVALRILHLIDHSIPHFSGYSFRSRYVVAMQQRLGFEVEVVTSARHDDFKEPVERFDDITYHRTTKPADSLSRLQLKIPFWRERLLTRAMVDRLEQVARTFRPDVLHAHSPFFNGQAALRVGRKLGIPVVYEIRAFWEDDAVDKNKFAEDSFVYRQVRRLETDVAREVNHLICICGGLRDDMLRRGIPPEKISIIKNGAEPESFSPLEKPADLARKLGLGGKRVLGFIGSFFHYEGLPDLVLAAARLRTQYPDLAWLLVGGGEDEPAVKKAIADAGLEGHVVLTGRVPHGEIAAHYALCDGLIYPRRSKRLTELVTPLKPLEAMAMERVVLGSSVGGIRELFLECDVGTLFQPDDPAALDAAIRGFMQRSLEELRDEGRRGRLSVLKHRRWDTCVAPIAQVYEQITGLKPVGVQG